MQAPDGEQAHHRGSCQTDVEGCRRLEVIVVATFSEPVTKAGAVVVVARIAEVEAVKANTADILSDVEVHKVMVGGADDQAGAAPQVGRGID